MIKTHKTWNDSHSTNFYFQTYLQRGSPLPDTLHIHSTFPYNSMETDPIRSFSISFTLTL